MTRKKVWLIIGCLLAIGSMVLILYGPSSARGSGTKELKGEVVLTVSSLSDEVTHPHLISKTGGNYPVGYAMHQGLTRFPTDPGLAESWNVSQDGTTYTFKLRKGLKFHNGDPLTAEEAKYGMEMCLRPEVPNLARSSIGKYIKSLEVVDKYTLAMHLTSTFPDFINYHFMDFQPLPKAYIEKVGEKAYAKNPFGSGPFKLVKHVRNDYLAFEGFEDYWGEGPFIKKFTMKIVPEASTRLAMLKTRTSDIADKMVGNVAKQIQDDPKLRIISGASTGILQITFPDIFDKNSPTSDKRVRLALNYAIDREAISQGIFYGEAKPIYTPIIPRWHAWYNPAWKPYSYDPEKAKQLLAEAGYAKGFEIALAAGRGGSAPFAPETAEAVASNLLAVGVKAKFREFEPGIHWANYRNKKIHGLAMHMHTFMKGPYRNLNFFRSDFLYSYFANEWFDEQILKGYTMSDQDARGAHTRRLAEWLNEQVASIPLVATNMVAGVGPKIVDWKPYPGSSMPSGFESIKTK
jgi:peptide/nickel transport system substrate-binding protein